MPPFDPSLLAPEQVRPLRRREFDKLVESGLFGEDERIELLQGYLVAMNPPGPEHASIVNRLNRALTRGLGDRALVSVQNPLAASEYSLPEPDLAVVPDEDYRDHHPTRAYLVIEVADTSLSKDREIKSRLYAAMGVPEYWVVDLRGKVVERYVNPQSSAYLTATSHSTGEIELVAFPGVRVDLAEIWR